MRPRSRTATGIRPDDERGDVMLMVIWLMVIVLLFGLAIALVNLSSSNTTTLNARQSRAQQAADAGVQAKMYQQSESTPGGSGSTFDLNGGLLGSSGFLDCVEPVLNSALQITSLTFVSASGGTCPASSSVSGAAITPIGNHASYESLFFPGASTVLSGSSTSEVQLQPRIVSLGVDRENSKTVYSRQEAILYPIDPLPVIGGNDNTTITGVSLSGGLLGVLLGKLGSLATTINGDIDAANDVGLPSVDAGLNLTLSNGLQGVVQYGNQLCNSTSSGSLTCPASPTPISTADFVNQAPPVLRPITLPSAAVMPDCPATNCTTLGSDYNSTTDSLTVPTGKTLVINPGTYVFCNVVEQGTGAITAEPSATAPVEIFIDNPNSARCSGNGTPVLSSGTNSATGHVEYNDGNLVAPNGISNGAGNVTGVLGASGLQIYVVGDQPTSSSPYDDDTYVQIGTPGYSGTNGGLLGTNLATEEAVVYAPTSEVTVTTAQSVNLGLLGSIDVPGVFDGNLIGDDVTAAALTFTQDLDLGNFALYNDISLYHVEKYVTCDNSVTSLTSSTTQAQATSGC